LQLLGKDHPAAAEQVQEISEILNQAMERIRTVSRDLNPSPVYRGGLKNALARLAEDVNRSSKAEVRLDYAATAGVGLPAAEALYDAAYAAIGQAVRGGGAARVHIRVTGAKGLTLRIADDGRSKGRAAALWVARLLARGAGLSFEIATGKSTIVSIKYALRRPTRG
jgi:signal transduction histidine kinase